MVKARRRKFLGETHFSRKDTRSRGEKKRGRLVRREYISLVIDRRKRRRVNVGKAGSGTERKEASPARGKKNSYWLQMQRGNYHINCRGLILHERFSAPRRPTVISLNRASCRKKHSCAFLFTRCRELRSRKKSQSSRRVFNDCTGRERSVRFPDSFSRNKALEIRTVRIFLKFSYQFESWLRSWLRWTFLFPM